MSTTEPIRDKKKLEDFRNFYKDVKPNPRNYLLIVTAMNTALRISDVITLRWRDLYDFSRRKFRKHLYLMEKKTKKRTAIYINVKIREAGEEYRREVKPRAREYVFKGYGEGHMCRETAYRIVKSAAKAVGLEEHISPHSLRKTFGYQAWKKGVPPAILMSIYNHSSYQITKRYLGIEQDDKDSVYKSNEL